MKLFSSKRRNALPVSPFLFLLLPILLFGCKNDKKSSPILSPQASLAHFQPEKGFEIKLVASEPLVQAPVALTFDTSGRIWVVEMTGYMPDTSGTNENTNPNGKIVILEDTDHDGVMDQRKVFMDSLVLPRAIRFYEDGLLMVEPPNLWFVKIQGDTAGAKYLIDSLYAAGGNPEHKANTLLRGIDNWLYSAKSDKRYRRINGKWIKQRTHFRGQWGITQDKYGRLFYNNNSVNLLGDYFLPSLGAWNPHQKKVSGYNEMIVSDTRTYPIHPTPGVNRGYQEGVLDDSLRLQHLTAACGPVIYQDPLFGKEYQWNAFVAEPAGNLVKRDILYQNGNKIKGDQAYKGKEFLASDDERFRPTSLYVGPEGALYIVDMYRGIIQDIHYLTTYLKNEIVERELAQPLNRGRIYKVIPTGEKTTLPVLSGKSLRELVALLDSKNAWKRRTAQRLITDGKRAEVADQLRRKLRSDTFEIGRIHVFWTLEGLGKLRDSGIELFLQNENTNLQAQAIAAIVSKMDRTNVDKWIKKGEQLFARGKSELMPYVAYLAAKAMQYNPADAENLLLQLAKKYPDNRLVVDAVISGLYNRETLFLNKIKEEQGGLDTHSVLYKHLKATIKNSKDKKQSAGSQFSKGKVLYTDYCQVCHGGDGAGRYAAGAPLDGSQWVTGNKETLAAIVLYGLKGPIEVAGKTYKAPEVAGEMPGFAQNRKLSDENIAQILNYIRNAWSNVADPIAADVVKSVKKKYGDRKAPFTKEIQ